MAPLPANIQHAAWGVEHALGTPFDTCVVTDYAENAESQHQYEYDQKGAVAGAAIYDKRITVTATIQVPKTITLPEAGTLITIGEKEFLLTSCNVVQNNQSFRKVSITAERYVETFSNNNVIQAGGTSAGGTSAGGTSTPAS